MTERSDDQAFENQLDRAVQDMHQQMPRGNRPSSRTWSIIAEQVDMLAGDSGSDPNQQNHRIPSSPRKASSKQQYQVGSRMSSHLGWSTWLAAALVVGLIGASVNFLNLDNAGNNRDDNSIALAPGTPDISTEEALQIASPLASPEMYIPVHGPEFACNVDPLTVDEVYRIVLNPGNGYTAKDPEFYYGQHGLYESRDRMYFRQMEAAARQSYAVAKDPSVKDPITEAANSFWNCLMTGTALQVWALMEPSAVQHEILMLHPVLRSEESLRKHIEEWGPRRYSAGLYHTFPDLGNVPPYTASMHVNETYGSIRIGYSQGEPWKAVVTMVNHPESTWYRENDLLLVIAPDGTWWVSMIFYDD